MKSYPPETPRQRGRHSNARLTTAAAAERGAPPSWRGYGPLAVGLLCLAVLAGCGQRGPLYLPEDAPPAPSGETVPTSPDESREDDAQA